MYKTRRFKNVPDFPGQNIHGNSVELLLLTEVLFVDFLDNSAKHFYHILSVC